MSPEQARGQTVDKRADIWAFGCVVFEMLTGSPRFGGATMSDTVVAVLEREPNWHALPRRPSARISDTSSSAVCRKTFDDGCVTSATRTTISRRAPPTRFRQTAPTSSRHRHVEFQRLTDEVGINESPAISPDGKMVAFVAAVNGKQPGVDPAADRRRSAAGDEGRRRSSATRDGRLTRAR